MFRLMFIFRPSKIQIQKQGCLVHCGIPNAYMYLVFIVEMYLTVVSVVNNISCIHCR